jgi:UDP-GlcNAc3NAcA epimerase
MKILTIIGARPQIIKSSAISRAVAKRANEIEEIVVHTGQHYDKEMSDVFFDELSIPQPKYNLNIGSGKHGQQTGKMIAGIEELLEIEKPNAILVYGDTNSTLAGAVAASKIHIPIVHVEAGLRSYNKRMPEEVNRIMADHVSTMLMCPTNTALETLKGEGFKLDNQAPYNIDNPAVFFSGDVMYDNAVHFETLADKKELNLGKLEVGKDYFILVTVHRDYNTDQADRLENILEGLIAISEKYQLKVVFPIHPRTKGKVEALDNKQLVNRFLNHKNIEITLPMPFLDLVKMMSKATLIVSDSGGVQKEAYFFKKPCLVLRTETEWTELVENGNNLLCESDKEEMLSKFDILFNKKDYTFPSFYGNGNASEFIIDQIITHIK